VRVLIAAGYLAEHSGAELYVAEIAESLMERAHEVTVFAPRLGPLADKVRFGGVGVTDNLRDVTTPDVIHGQGPLAVTSVLDRFPAVPALVVCHDHREVWPRRVLTAPSVVALAGVSRVCTKELVDQGAPVARTELMLNFVDTDRFQRRPPLPKAPKRALMFSNYARPDGYVEEVRSACDSRGICLDVVGSGVGNRREDPERILVEYDIVIAKGRSALEAAAVGCAVVLCDFAGVGPMVTPEAFDDLREKNFGYEALTTPHSQEAVGHQLDKYDAAASSEVCERLRAECSLEQYVNDLEARFAAMVSHGSPTSPARPAPARVASALHLLAIRRYRALPESTKRRLRSVMNPVRHRVAPSWRRMAPP
jgi:hypothetical protein